MYSFIKSEFVCKWILIKFEQKEDIKLSEGLFLKIRHSKAEFTDGIKAHLYKVVSFMIIVADFYEVFIKCFLL